MIEFEQKMAELRDGLSPDARTLALEVLGLELRQRFNPSGRSQFSEEFAARALRAVKAQGAEGAGA